LNLAAQAAERARRVVFSCLDARFSGYPSGDAAGVAGRRWRRCSEGGLGREGGGRLERVVFCRFEEKDERVHQECLPYVILPFYAWSIGDYRPVWALGTHNGWCFSGSDGQTISVGLSA